MLGRKLLLVAFGLTVPLFLIGIFEICVRVYWTPPESTSSLGNIPASVFNEHSLPKYVGEPFVGSYVKNNSYGFRHDTEFEFKKPSNTVRIILLGGSVAYGAWSSSREFTAMGQLEKCLVGTKGERVEVLGLGESGAESTDELFWLVRLGLRLEPDLVLSLGGYNDLFSSAANPRIWDKGSMRSGYARAGAISPLKRNSWESVKNTFLEFTFALHSLINRYSHGYQLLTKLFEKSEKTEEDSPAIRHKKHMDSTILNVEQAMLAAKTAWNAYESIAVILMQLKVPYMLFLQPIRGCDLASPTDALLRDWTLCDVFRKEGSSRAPRQVLHYKDLSLLAKNLNDSFVDPVHLDDRGFEILGQEMCAEVAKEFPSLVAKQNKLPQRQS